MKALAQVSTQVFQQIKRAFPQGGVARNSSWLLSAELVARVSRLLTIIALSSQLTSAMFGIVMLALACHEIIRTIMRCGAGTQLVQCAENKLTLFAETAKALQWMLALVLLAVQCGVAFIVGVVYENAQLTSLILCMGITYLLFPVVSVNVFLLQREGKFKYFSVRNAVCIIAENVAVAALVFSPLGLWSVVAGKFVFAALWVCLFYRAPVAQYACKVNLSALRYLVSTSIQLFVSELLKASRQHADLFIASKVFTPETAGLYAFARSGGVGLTQSLSTAFSSALFPFLCTKVRENHESLLSGKLVLACMAIASAFVVQGLLAPVYIPIFFSDKWALAIPVVSVLCFAAAPFLLFEIQNTAVRARGLYKQESAARLLLLLTTAVVFFAIAPQSPMQLACCMLLSNAVTVLLIFFYQFKPRLNTSVSRLSQL